MYSTISIVNAATTLIMELNPLTAISPIDGRYRKQVHHLHDYFSEFALIKYRVIVEVEYFLFLTEKDFFDFPAKGKKFLREVLENFSIEDAKSIKETEKVTNHDVKAVEYFLKNKLQDAGIEEGMEWIHFGLTSQDINNTAIPLSWKHAIEFEYLPALLNFNQELKLLANDWKDIAMLAVTFMVSTVTLSTGRTYLMQGAVHLVLFAAFLFLALVP